MKVKRLKNRSLAIESLRYRRNTKWILGSDHLKGGSRWQSCRTREDRPRISNGSERQKGGPEGRRARTGENGVIAAERATDGTVKVRKREIEEDGAGTMDFFQKFKPAGVIDNRSCELLLPNSFRG